jgi:hypothetical protein
MKSPATVSPPSAGKFFAFGSRRDFLKTAAAGTAAAAIPVVFSSCKIGDTLNGVPGPSGTPLVLDFSRGDVAYLQFVYVYKQVQADLYARAVAAFTGSDLTTTEQSVFTDVKNHEAIHRDTLKAILGTDAITATPVWGTFNFKKAADVVPTAQRFEDNCVGLFNGMFQHLISPANIALLLEMHSVDARHSAAIRDELVPKNGGNTGFSPATADPAYPLSGVAAVLQPLINEVFQFTNAPAGI